MKYEANSIKPMMLTRKTLATLVFSTLISTSAGISADDTEIFFGQTDTQANVLFVVDISGSMSGRDGPTEEPGPTRLERLKTALTDIVETTNDINVGLMAYSRADQFVKQQIAPVTQNRQAMLDAIDELANSGGTPTLAALYKAGQYMRGESFRVTDDKDDAGEYIVGIDDYTSPMTSQCQSNHIVLLTDGDPSVRIRDVNTVEAAIFPPDAEVTSCAAVEGMPGGKCGAELAAWLKHTDHVDDTVMDGVNNIVTHTIGFNFSHPWLATVSTAAGGTHHNAESASDLIEAFDTILEVAADSSQSFAAPAITLDQLTRYSNREDMYLTLFQPDNSQRWPGNLKRYKFDGSIKDKNNAVAIDLTAGTIAEEAHSFWSATADGANVSNGGAAALIDPDQRPLYTYLGSNIDLTNDSNQVHVDGPVSMDLLGVDTVEERADLLNWTRGEDVDDEDENPNTTTRNHMGDPLHSRPVILTYGQTEIESEVVPNSVIFVGTNDGFLHAINSTDGEEVFAFIPEELLPNLKTIRENDRTTNRVYGIDGDLTLWVNDKDGNGAISGTEEHAYLYMGMRRGGDFYYALDVTTKGTPKYLWSKGKGDTGYERLGQSWSKPTLSKVSIGGEVTDVLIFGGGYDSGLDNSSMRSADTVGNDMYIVNAKTGAVIWNTSTPSDTTYYQNNMQYSIPSDPRIVDLNGDGIVDQIYIGDMGGQVWRFDVDSNASDAQDLVTGGVIANLAGEGTSGDGDNSSNRRFFYPPDVALVDYHGDKFLSVSIGSGNRAHPLGQEVENRFYMIRQRSIFEAPEKYGMIDLDNSTETSTVYRPIEEGDLYNATENLIDSTTIAIADSAASTLKSKQGWLIDLDVGEKVLAPSLTVSNQVMFTTYLPQIIVTDNCAPATGIGRSYSVNVFDASPTSGTDPDDRYKDLVAGGIPSQPVPFIDEEGGLTVMVGTETVDTPVFQPETRVYWTEQPDY